MCRHFSHPAIQFTFFNVSLGRILDSIVQFSGSISYVDLANFLCVLLFVCLNVSALGSESSNHITQPRITTHTLQWTSWRIVRELEMNILSDSTLSVSVFVTISRAALGRPWRAYESTSRLELFTLHSLFSLSFCSSLFFETFEENVKFFSSPC